MYQKIKYIIIATMVLLVIVVVLTLDANTRYASMNKQKKEQTAKNISDMNRQYYEMQQRMNQASLNKDVTDDVNKYKNLQNVTSEDDDEDESQEDIQNSSQKEKRKIYRRKEQTAYINSEQDENTTNTTQILKKTHIQMLSQPTGKLSCENCETGKSYNIEKAFNLDGEEFAIISITKGLQGNNTYLNNQYVIYKKVNDEYKYSNYLFETTSNVNSTMNAITIEENDNSIIIKHNNITRKLDNYVVKNGYQQYGSYPALKYTTNEDTGNEASSYQQ